MLRHIMLPLDSHALKQALRYNGRNRRGQLQANAASGVTSLVRRQAPRYTSQQDLIECLARSMSHPSSSYDISQSFTRAPGSFSDELPSFALSTQPISRDLTSQVQETQPDESDLHALLASELFEPSLNTRQAVAPRPIPSCSSNSWTQRPTAPANYQTQALRPFEAQIAVQQEDVASTPGVFAGHRVGLVDGVTQSPDVSVSAVRAEGTKDRDIEKSDHARRGKKRFALQNEGFAPTIYDRLASTVTELRELKARHKQLESKNVLLEKCLKLEQSQKSGALSSEETACEDHYLAQETGSSGQPASIMVSVRGEPRSMTVFEVGRLEVTEFAALWTDYIQSIGACLVQIGSATEGPMVDLMQQLTVESSQLHGCIKLLNHKVHKAMLQGHMDPKLAKAHSIDTFYKSFVGLLELSQDQFQDWETLRRIYLARRGTLAMERKMLVHQAAKAISTAEETVPLPGNTRIAGLAARLQEIAQEDYRVYHRIAAAVRRGVLTTKQWATLIVHAYPYMPDIESALESVAKSAGQPPKKVLMSDRSLGNMAAEWEGLEEYLEVVAKNRTHNYTPLSVSKSLFALLSASGERSAAAVSAEPFRPRLGRSLLSL